MHCCIAGGGSFAGGRSRPHKLQALGQHVLQQSSKRRASMVQGSHIPLSELLLWQRGDLLPAMSMRDTDNPDTYLV